MTIPSYGVWVATPISFTAQRAKQDAKSPHINLIFKDDSSSSTQYSSAINVKSTDKDSRLVYWLNNNLKNDLTTKLQALSPGFHSISKGDGLGLDYTDGLVTISDGKILQSDVPGPNNDIIDMVSPILQSSIDKKATIYLFGSEYDTKDGIHDVHMNQGSLPKYDNGKPQDGALVIHFTDQGDDHWEGVFLAFASQEIPTDDNGLATSGAKALSDVV